MGTYHDSLIAARQQRLTRLAGAQTSPAGDEIAALQGRIAELEGRVEKLLRRLPRSATRILNPVGASAAAETPDALLATAIKQVICRLHRVTLPELEGSSISDRFTEARRIAMYLARRLGGWTFPQIGLLFGRSHRAAVVACQTIERQRATDADLDRSLAAIEAELVQAE
jgi:chromosomal replication initiation ATPase DnaA